MLNLMPNGENEPQHVKSDPKGAKKEWERSQNGAEACQKGANMWKKRNQNRSGVRLGAPLATKVGFVTFSDFFDAILGSILKVFGSIFGRKIDDKINAKIDAEKVLNFASELIKISKKLSQNQLKY